jgi:hypothetical protein
VVKKSGFRAAYLGGHTAVLGHIHTLFLGMNSKIRATVENLKHPASTIFFIPCGAKSYVISEPRARTEFSQRSCNFAQG